MIRGPVLPQQREGLWPLLASRLAMIEQGLALVAEGLDLSSGQLGAIDGLARDAASAPVLLALAVEGDPLLLPRIVAAAEFLERAGDSLATAVPEAKFGVGLPGRILVVGTAVHPLPFAALRRLHVRGVELVCLEPFRLADKERFAVRWLTKDRVAAAGDVDPAGSPEAAEPVAGLGLTEAMRATWFELERLCSRIDPAVRFDGDRFRRRVTWQGHALGEILVEGGRLVGQCAAGDRFELASRNELRVFGDRLLRHFSRAAGVLAPSAAAESHSPGLSGAAPRHAAYGRSGLAGPGHGLRAALMAARLSQEEYSALGGSALAADGEPGAAVVAGDGPKAVAGSDVSWPTARCPD
jgi:hypothetical protein